MPAYKLREFEPEFTLEYFIIAIFFNYWNDRIYVVFAQFYFTFQAQNSPFPQIFSTSLLAPMDCLHGLLDRTYSAQRFFILFIYFFLFWVVR